MQSSCENYEFSRKMIPVFADFIEYLWKTKNVRMDQNTFAHTKDLIVRDFELEKHEEETLTEEDLFRLLADQISYMIEYRMEYLLSLMYRLDIDERKVNDALAPFAPEPANIGLARLVLDRQKRRAYTKAHYKQEEKLDDDWIF